MIERKKLLIYKILLFAFAAFVAFMPSTVSRSSEVNSRVIVEILGIDGGQNVSVTAQYVMPSEQQGASGKDTVTVSAPSLTEALESLNTALGRRAELGHCSMVVVGKDAPPQLLGTLMTATDVTADVYLAAAEDKASELVGNITDFMTKTGATDADFIAYSAKKAHVATNTLLGFLSDLGSASRTAYMPVVEMIEPADEQGEQGGEQSGEQSGGEEQSGKGGKGGEGGKSEQSGMKVERLALYGADARAGIADKKAARGVAWLSAPVEKSVVTAQTDGQLLSAVMLKKHTSIKIGGKKATVKIKAYIEPNGDAFNKLNNGKADVMDEVKKSFAQVIEGEVRAAYTAGREYDCDPLFIDRQFYRYAPEYFKNGYARGLTDVAFDIEVVIK